MLHQILREHMLKCKLYRPTVPTPWVTVSAVCFRECNQNLGLVWSGHKYMKISCWTVGAYHNKETAKSR